MAERWSVDEAPNPWPTSHDEEEQYEEWQQEVANGDTVSGFRDWLKNREEW